jgi:PiT family inorganic phosphate transporter
VAWVITLPAAAVVGALATLVASTSTIGLVVVAVLALVGGSAFFVLARRKPVTRDTVNDEQPAGEPVSA